MNTPLSARMGVRRMGPALLALLFVMAAPGAFAAESSPQVAAQAQSAPPQAAAPAAPQASAPAQAAQNTQDGAVVISNDAPGYNGYAGTWRDPETGDIITSVIAPRRPQEQTQQQPIYIAPQIDPDWPANGYGNQGWNGGWQSGGNNGWNNGWPSGWNGGWNNGAQPGPGQSWRPGPSAPGMGTPPSAMMPGPPPFPPQSGQPGQPGVRPPQQADRPGPGGLPLPDMQPGVQPPQGAIPPAQPGTTPAFRPPATGPQGNWQGPPPNWRPPNWQPGNWQPNWQQPAGPSGAWRPWGPAGTGSGVKAWTPGQPPHGDWQPLSWSPPPMNPAGAAGAWNPWQPYGPRRPSMMGGMRPGMGPGMRGRFAAMPVLPPNITRHLGPVVPLGQRGGSR